MKNQITIADPCNQNWDKMEKRAGQNFCEACNKCVVDFSRHSNAEIINVLRNASTEICGRLSETQLNQINSQLTLVPKNSYWLKYAGVLAIGIGLFNPGAVASPTQHPIEINKTIFGVNANTAKPLPVKIISGYIFDESKKPLVGIRVIIRNTKLFAVTDKNGKYAITLNNKFDKANNGLEVESLRYVGFLMINYHQQKQTDLILSKSETMIMGKMIMVKGDKKCL